MPNVLSFQLLTTNKNIKIKLQFYFLVCMGVNIYLLTWKNHRLRDLQNRAELNV
jgi:hypothetical protein